MINAKWRCRIKANRLKDGTCCCSYCEGFEDGMERATRQISEFVRSGKCYWGNGPDYQAKLIEAEAWNND